MYLKYVCMNSPTFFYTGCLIDDVTRGQETGHEMLCTVKPVWNSHSKIDKTKILMTNGI